MYSYLKRVTQNGRGRQETYYRICKGEIISFNVTSGKLSKVQTLQLIVSEVDVLSKEDFESEYEKFKQKYSF